MEENNQDLAEIKRQLDQLVSEYTNSKAFRIAAAYNDTPLHLRHKVHEWFGVHPRIPAIYFSIRSAREAKK